MKLKATIYYPLFFTFCILASLIASTLQNIKTPIAKFDNVSYKHISFSDKEQNTTNSDFLFEENEIETETFVGLKLLTNILPYFIAFFQSETLQPTSNNSHFLENKPNNPIYISVCNFRI